MKYIDSIIEDVIQTIQEGKQYEYIVADCVTGLLMRKGCPLTDEQGIILHNEMTIDYDEGSPPTSAIIDNIKNHECNPLKLVIAEGGHLGFIIKQYRATGTTEDSVAIQEFNGRIWCCPASDILADNPKRREYITQQAIMAMSPIIDGKSSNGVIFDELHTKKPTHGIIKFSEEFNSKHMPDWQKELIKEFRESAGDM